MTQISHFAATWLTATALLSLCPYFGGSKAQASTQGSASTIPFNPQFQYVGAPLESDAFARLGKSAVAGVLRVICENPKNQGTGFVHRSGNVITAAHIVHECKTKDIRLLHGPVGAIRIKRSVFDEKLDLALLEPDHQFTAGFGISDSDLTIGSAVTTWGFPAGYPGVTPLLTVGYLSGASPIPTPKGPVLRLFINAAFNGGNSGGPLFNVDDGKVIGVVAAKLAPTPKYIVAALNTLKKQKAGLMFTATLPDGTKRKMNQAELIADVLLFLRSQAQLVVGMAAPPGDIRAFLKAQGVEP